MLFNYQSSCIAHQGTCLFYQMSKCLSTTFLFFLISYFQTAYESVLFRVVPADSLYIISPLPLSVNNFFTIISYLMNHFLQYSLIYYVKCQKTDFLSLLMENKRKSASCCTTLYYFVTVQNQAKFQKTGIKCLHF